LHDYYELAEDAGADANLRESQAPALRQLGGQTFATSGDQYRGVQVAEASGASGSSCL